jgi:hypothetical protein
VLPANCPPEIARKMLYASQVFRMFDKDHSGTLDKAFISVSHSHVLNQPNILSFHSLLFFYGFCVLWFVIV